MKKPPSINIDEIRSELDKIPYSKCTKFEIPDYMIELYIEYVRVQHRDRKLVMAELNKRLPRPAGEKLWRNRVAEYEKLKFKEEKNNNLPRIDAIYSTYASSTCTESDIKKLEGQLIPNKKRGE